MAKLQTCFSLFLVLAASFLNGSAQVTNGKIAFVSNRDGNREIYVMDPDGTRQTRITNTPENESGPSWSPDGRTLAFLRQSAQGATLNLIDENGGNLRTIPDVFCDEGAIDWSPDGIKLVFRSAGQIHTVRYDGSDRTTLTRPYGFDKNPSWSPDGQAILFERNWLGFGGGGIYSIGVTGDGLYPIALHPFLYAGFFCPSWAPDGQRLLFTVPSQGDMAPNDTVVSVLPNGTGYTPLYQAWNTDVVGPKFSPDGTTIVFAETSGPTFGMIYQIGVPGRALTDLSSNNLQPDWQPLRPALTISGRVTTAGGQALRNATVALSDQAGSKRLATTSSFGIYEFDGVRSGETYSVSIASKRYRFQVRNVTPTTNVTAFDFVGLE